MTLEDSERQAAAVQKPGTDRVTLEYMQSRIKAQAFRVSEVNPWMTICEVRFDNGFTIVGTSAPADPENFNAEFGKKLAFDDAMRQAWAHFGFALCEKRHHIAIAMGELDKVALEIGAHPGEYVRKLQQTHVERVVQQRADALKEAQAAARDADDSKPTE